MSSNLSNNDENNNKIVLLFVNKKFQSKPITCSFKESTTLSEVKKYLLTFFHRNTRNRISGFRLVREGPPDDNIEDTIPENYFDDAYNDMKISEFKTLIEDNHIYDNEINGIPSIYFRSIITNDEKGD